MILRGERVAGAGLIVVRLLGEGGMGEVYEVEHPELGRRFALKVLHRHLRDRQDLAGRLRREARALGRVRHPNLVEVLDLGVTADGRPFFVMELLAGRDLRAELARRGPLPPLEALSLLEQALAGLGAAHQAGIVHRDIKLENLFLVDAGPERGVLKVLDFGVAKLAEQGASRTAAGVVLGTPRSMAPEQCARGAAEVDERADLYAAGLALYELCAGRGPFDELRGQPDALRFAHCDRPPPPPSRFAPRPLPPPVERLILRALEKSPDRRFQSAEEMAAEVRLARAELGAAPTAAALDATLPDGRTPAPLRADDTAPVAAPPRPGPWRRRRRAGRPRPRRRRPLPLALAPLARLRRPLPSSAPARAPAPGPALASAPAPTGLAAAPPGLAAAIGIGALVLASLALGVSLAGRLPPFPRAAEPVDAASRAAVR